MSVSVIIPTFRRNDALERAARSVFEQSLTPGEILIVDNSPEAGAQETCAKLKDLAPCPLVYIHEPNPGVSNARNSGFAKAQFGKVAQLDDDETASNDWLKSLVETSDAHESALVFGPVRSAPIAGVSGLKADWLARLYSRIPDHETGLIDEHYGCGNSLIDRNRVELPSPVFDIASNDVGGEDDVLFAYLVDHGALRAWSNEACVIEHVEDQRLNWRNMFQRSFSHGQSPTQYAAAAGRRHLIPFWMAVGAAQLLVFSALALPARILSTRACAKCLDKAVQGLGKILWNSSLTPQFYGAAKLKP